MEIKIFKSNISESTDTNSIESKINSFIQDKQVIDIKQSIAPSADPKNTLKFLVITVMYE